MISDAHLTSRQSCYFDLSVFAAAKQGNLDKIRAYIKHRGWIDAPNARGNSMLSIAAKHGMIRVVSYLLEHGAQFYPNLKGKTVYERATEEIKKFLRLIQRPAITPTQLIYAKMKSLPSNEITSFLSSIQPIPWHDGIHPDYRYPKHRPDITALSLTEFANALNTFQDIDRRSVINNFLQSYLYHFPEKDILAFLDSLTESDQVIAQTTLAETALSCGDIDFATQIVQTMNPSYRTYRLLCIQIQCFSKSFAVLNQCIINNPQVCKKEILSAFEPLGLSSVPVNEIIACESFDAAIRYSFSLPRDLRSDILYCFRSCPHLKQLYNRVLVTAQNNLEDEAKRFDIQLDPLLRIGENTKDYRAIANSITLIPREYSVHAHKFTALASKAMCLHGLYQDAYALIEKSIQRSHSNDIQQAVEFILQLLETKNKPGWKNQFRSLLT